jgi:16S rRNA processing protein RimM
VRFEGVNDRAAAERLVNTELYVSRARLPEQSGGNSFYQADLVGLRVEARDGAALGSVAAVANYGAGDLLEVKPANGGATFLVPFADPFVPEIDVAGGRVIVELPEDFFAQPRRET